MLLRKIEIDNNYLHFPVKIGAPKQELQIWLGNYLLRQFHLELSEEGEDWFFLDVSDLVGNTLCLNVQLPQEITAAALDKIVCGNAPTADNPLYPNLYAEKFRPQFHFSSKRGWLNDPNGLVYNQGKYHMYYQHNPLGTSHGGVNVSWGHAVSDDLLHWQELSDAIMPWRRDFSIASGSAIVDEDNVSGFGKGATIAAFTALNSFNSVTGNAYPSDGQYLAASTDGQSFTRFCNCPVIETKDGLWWRDPRILKYGDKFVIAVYETFEGKNCVSFYNSTDLYNWKFMSRSPDLYECPDLFPLKVEGTEEEAWVLYGADGKARVGRFDGESFADSGYGNMLDYGTSTYAGQTWSNEPNGKRIHISWIRGMSDSMEWNGDMGYGGMPFSQCMSLPCELTLRKLGDAYRICRKPIDGVKSLRQSQGMSTNADIGQRYGFSLAQLHEYALTLTGIHAPISFAFSSYIIQYNAVDKTITFPNGLTAALDTDALSLRIFVDATTVELFFNDEISATYALDTSDVNMEIVGAFHVSLDNWQLKSVW